MYLFQAIRQLGPRQCSTAVQTTLTSQRAGTKGVDLSRMRQKAFCRDASQSGGTGGHQEPLPEKLAEQDALGQGHGVLPCQLHIVVPVHVVVGGIGIAGDSVHPNVHEIGFSRDLELKDISLPVIGGMVCHHLNDELALEGWPPVHAKIGHEYKAGSGIGIDFSLKKTVEAVSDRPVAFLKRLLHTPLGSFPAIDLPEVPLIVLFKVFAHQTFVSFGIIIHHISPACNHQLSFFTGKTVNSIVNTVQNINILTVIDAEIER